MDEVTLPTIEEAPSDESAARNRRSRTACALVIAVFTAVSIVATNPYRYGSADHCITIPYLKHELNKDLYPTDYLLEQKPYYYTYLWNSLAALARLTDVDIAWLFFAVYAVSVYLTFAGIFLIGTALFGSWQVGIVSLVLLLWPTKFLAYSATLQSMLLTKTVALPITLFAIWLFLRGRHVGSFALQGLAFLVHPMTAVYATVMVLAASVSKLREIRPGRLAMACGALIAVASPILAWRLLHPPDSSAFLAADPHWVELLRLRSSHHMFPFSWGAILWLRAGLVCVIFALSCKQKPPRSEHRTVLAFALAVLGMCLVGTVFSELVPVGVVLMLQPLRSFQFFVYFAMLYFANHLVSEAQRGRERWRALAIAPLAIVFVYPTESWPYGYAAFLAVVAALMGYRSLSRIGMSWGLATGMITVWVCVAAAGSHWQGSDFRIHNTQRRAWLSVQQWAKDRSDVSDVFIVPPDQGGFRVESERTIYGDWKDGTLMNFSPAFGTEWMRRMTQLGYHGEGSLKEGFSNLSEQDFRQLAHQIGRDQPRDGRTFVVRSTKDRLLRFPVVYFNRKYVVYRVEPQRARPGARHNR